MSGQNGKRRLVTLTIDGRVVQASDRATIRSCLPPSRSSPAMSSTGRFARLLTWSAFTVPPPPDSSMASCFAATASSRVSGSAPVAPCLSESGKTERFPFETGAPTSTSSAKPADEPVPCGAARSSASPSAIVVM